MIAGSLALFLLRPADSGAQTIATQDSVQISRITAAELRQKLEDQKAGKIFFDLVDLRLEKDFAAGFIPGAVNIPLKKLPFVAEKIFGKSDEIIFYGYSEGDRASINAGIFLKNKGFSKLLFLESGYKGWQESYSQT